MGLNVDTITIAEYLYRNDAERAAIVARAQAATAGPKARPAGYDAARQELAQFCLPVGWSGGWAALRPSEGGGVWNFVLAPLLRWLMTALAASMAQLAVQPVAAGAPATSVAPAPPPAPAPLEDACDIPIMPVARDEDPPAARGGLA